MTTTWRDITGLTTEQADRLSNGGHLMTEADLLDMARDYRDHNILQASLAHIPEPAGATRITIWFDDLEGTVTREVYGTGWNIGNVNARITGTQNSTGAIVWRTEFDSVYGTVGDLNAVQAREMAAVMLKAADEVERLTDADSARKAQDAADDSWSAVPVDMDSPPFM